MLMPVAATWFAQLLAVGGERGSCLARLGLQPRDPAPTRDGRDGSALGKALVADLQLKKTDHLAVRIVRRGEPQTLGCQLR